MPLANSTSTVTVETIGPVKSDPISLDTISTTMMVTKEADMRDKRRAAEHLAVRARLDRRARHVACQLLTKLTCRFSSYSF